MRLVSNNTIEMTPQQYLKLVAPFGYQGGPKMDSNKIDTFAKIGWHSDPMLSVKETSSGKLQVGLHDGRHRALAAIKRGDTVLKVKIVRGKKYAREHPDISDADLAALVVKNGLMSEITEKTTFKVFLIEKLRWIKEKGNRDPVTVIDISLLKTNPNEVWSKEYTDGQGHKWAASLANQMKKEKTFTALTVKKNDDGTYTVIDGQHRLFAAKMNGLKQIGVQIWKNSKDY